LSWRERVSIEVGDIAQADTEAIVNAANHELWMGSGVAGALKRAGGAAIEQEALRHAPIAVGDSVLTGAGTLPALNIIHAAAMAADRPATVEGVSAATLSALKLAAEQDIDSVAIPALGTGAGGLGFGDCAAAMFAAVALHCSEHAQPAEIKFVLLGQNVADVFSQVLAQV
jgi:O-acetyl-ADP-ribose deacetylase (regulator of RNase III)